MRIEKMKNSIIIKKIENEKFIMIDEGIEKSIDYKIIDEKIKDRKTKEIIKINHWILLPENSIKRKGFRIEDFEDKNEIEYFERKSPEYSESQKYDFEKYLTEEELEILQDLKNKSLQRYNLEKSKLENPIYKEISKTIKEIERISKEYDLNPNDIPKYIEAKNKLNEFMNK